MASVALIEVDPQLASGLDPEQREMARAALIAGAIRLPVGQWAEPPAEYGVGNPYGVFVVHGFVLRTVTIGERTTAQLFGPCDVMQAWPADDVPSPVPVEVSWSVLRPTVLARLDDRVLAMAARFPSVLRQIGWRTSSQAGRGGLQVAMARVPRLEERLLLLFWTLTERWGQMTPNGMLLPVRLTHETIASLTAASRPPVSSALSQLSRDGLLRRMDEGWLLTSAGEQHLVGALDHAPAHLVAVA
jgi:CRP/FNR family transcriptional regulator, cyclic AMP receptor protein